MLGRLLPRFIKHSIRETIQKISSHGLLYYESHPGASSYCVPPEAYQGRDQDELPVPPESMWLGYGADATGYLQRGQDDVDTMLGILDQGGFPARQAGRILEFGCCAGRMIRHLVKLEPRPELWGVDFEANYIQWCRDNLTPEIHFAVTTTVPHLPFEDRMFDLVFCGSVFTHIEDLAAAWLLELGRILRPGGRLYITIHDDHTVDLLRDELSDSQLARRMHADQVYQANQDQFGMIVVGRKAEAQVFHHPDYLKAMLPPIFRWVSHTQEAYGFQSAVVLEKQSPEISD